MNLRFVGYVDSSRSTDIPCPTIHLYSYDVPLTYVLEPKISCQFWFQENAGREVAIFYLQVFPVCFNDLHNLTLLEFVVILELRKFRRSN